jgi:hypothetical protein
MAWGPPRRFEIGARHSLQTGTQYILALNHPECAAKLLVSPLQKDRQRIK